MKLYLLLFFLAYSFSAIIKECEYDYNDETGESIEVNPKSSDDCNERLTEKDKQLQNKCCYGYYSNYKKEGECHSLTKEAYDNIDKYIDSWSKTFEILIAEEGKKLGDLHVDCYSSLVHIGLLSFILNIF